MKTQLSLIALAFISSSAFAAAQPNYSFVANSSYKADSTCMQSVFQATQAGDMLILADSISGSADVLKLTKKQVAQFKKLNDRQFGEVVTVTVKDGSTSYTFIGQSCGRRNCDELEIRSPGSEVRTLEQPIHGLNNISCN